jgi:hypothetical protein
MRDGRRSCRPATEAKSACAHAGHLSAEPSEENFKRNFQDLNINQYPVREINMRSFLLMAAAVLSFSATMTFETTEANAVVCARGVVRAGCAGARGAVVVRKPAVVCRTVVVNGVKVRRCG